MSEMNLRLSPAPKVLSALAQTLGGLSRLCEELANDEGDSASQPVRAGRVDCAEPSQPAPDKPIARPARVIREIGWQSQK